ncbi:MAG: ATP-binding protein [Minicystis sp.]
MPTTHRSVPPHEIGRAGLSLADTQGIVRDEDQALFQAYVNLVVTAPGAAMLVWGDESLCLAYNRAYRNLAAFRSSALGKPLLRAQVELERSFRGRLDQAMSGLSVALLPTEIPAAPGAARLGWILPVSDPLQVVKGALILVVEVTPLVDQVRRVMSSVAGDLRDALVGVRVVAERLGRVPKLTFDRLGADLGRVLELTASMDRMADDLATFSRFAGGTGLQVTLRPQDLGLLVRGACEELSASMEPQPSVRPSPSSSASPESSPPSAGKPSSSPEGSSSISGARSITGTMAPLSASIPPSRPGPTAIRFSVVEVRGAWDGDAIRRVVVNLVSVARRHSGDAAEIRVDLSTNLEGALLTVRGESKGGREEELAQMVETSSAAGDRRRSSANLSFSIARELVVAHGGRLGAERAGANGFVFRAILPVSGGTSSAALPARRP